MSDDLRFRFLLPEEFSKVDAICETHGWAVPHPRVGSIRVAEQDGQMVAFVCGDLLAHIGPGWIAEAHRTNPLIWEDAMRSMRERLEPGGLFPGVVMIAETSASEGIAERLGMKRSKGTLYVKEFSGDKG